MNSSEFIPQINDLSRGFHIVYGPMFAGKSSILIAVFWNDKKKNRNPIAFNYFADNRHGENCISSHDQHLPLKQRSCPAYQVNSVDQILEILAEKQQKHNKIYKTIIIDEVNLFDEYMLEFCQGKRDSGVKVAAGGLRRSSRGESFPFRKYSAIGKLHPQEHHFSDRTMDDLIRIADFEYLLRESPCSNILNSITNKKCGNIASFTQRFNRDGTIASYDSPLLVIGAGKDLNPEHDYYYESRCASCFIKPK